MYIAAYLVILFFALIGCPLFIIMSLIAIVANLSIEADLSGIAIAIYQLASQPTILTIPLFTFAGYLMAESKSPARMLRLSQAMFGSLPGGIAIVGLMVCAFFTAFTGASGVTIVALGGLLLPILLKEGYDEKFSVGLLTTSGSLGLLFPPSLPIILYGIVAQVDIDMLFKAGIVPGFFLIIVLSAYSIFKGGKIERKKFSFKELIDAFKGSFWEFLLPVGVLVGIYGGYTTVSEAAAFTAAYALFMECVVYRDIHPIKDVPKIIKNSMNLVGAIFLILFCAMAVTDFLVEEEIPMKILDAMKMYISNKYLFLFFLNLFLLVVGAMMDIFSAIVVVVPLIVPIAKEYDVHAIHLAIIFLTNLEIGFITPPVGINLFISSFRFNKPITLLYRYSVPFLILLLAALVVITYVPSLSLMWV